VPSPSKSNDSFIRSPTNKGALINTDSEGLQEYKKAKERFRRLNDIPKIEKRLDKIEELLEQLLVKLDGN